MKHQYFGDVNDYVKYGLLRCFADAGFRLGVCWMLTPEDQRSDGRKTAYLSHPEKWQYHDPQLFAALAAALAGPNPRHVRHIELNHHIPQARFFGTVVPDDKVGRTMWHDEALAALTNADLLFFDPDNGIEIPSKPIGRKDSSKYVHWEELEGAWYVGSSLLVFQYFPRVKRDKYIQALVEEFGNRTEGSTVVPLITSNMLFLLAHQPSHKDRVDIALQLIKERWANRIREHRAT